MATSGDAAIARESVYIVPGDTSPDAIARSLQALLPTRRHRIVRQRFTVLDTFDGRVRRSGARLTCTSVDGRLILHWRPRGGRGHVQMQLEQPVHFAWDLPESPLQNVLAPVIGVRRLLAQADAEEHGALLDVLDDLGKTVAHLRIAAGQARLMTSTAAWHPLPTVVTLTALRGYSEPYERLVPVIESRPGITAYPEGFESVILSEVGAPIPRDMSSPRVLIGPTARADAGARQIHQAILNLLVANEPGVRANLDTEFLHDFRVALRRTRSLLGQIKDVFPADMARHFSTEFSWVGRLTGPPRDLDVLVLRLRGRSVEIPPDDIDALAAFLARVQEEHREALIEALDSERYRRLLSDWASFLDREAAADAEADNAARPLSEVVSRRAWRLSRRIAGSGVTEDTPPGPIHDIRIAAKKLRYVIDVAPAFYDPTDLACILGTLKKLQRALGDFNDAAVHETRLGELERAFESTGGSAGAVRSLRRLADDSRQRQSDLRPQVMDRLAQFRGETTQSACRRAFKRGRSSGV